MQGRNGKVLTTCNERHTVDDIYWGTVPALDQENEQGDIFRLGLNDSDGRQGRSSLTDPVVLTMVPSGSRRVTKIARSRRLP